MAGETASLKSNPSSTTPSVQSVLPLLAKNERAKAGLIPFTVGGFILLTSAVIFVVVNWGQISGGQDATSPSGRLVVCRDRNCSEEIKYLANKFNTNVDLCEDFYGYVCSNQWFEENLDLDNRPYFAQAVGKILNGIHHMFKLYFHLKSQNYYKYRGAFLSQALFFVPNCTNRTSRHANGWAPFRNLLSDLGLDGWPYEQDLSNTSIPYVVGRAEGKLGIFSFTEVTVRPSYKMRYQIHIRPAETILKRHQLYYFTEGVDEYKQTIIKLLKVFNSRKADKIATELVQLEEKIQEAMLKDRMSRSSVVSKKVGMLPKGKMWSWETYLHAIFNEVYNLNKNDWIRIHSDLNISRLSTILNKMKPSTVLNYVGFKLSVQLSALLPDELHSFVPLSHDNLAQGIPERFKACMYLLENMFPYGTRMFARMSLDSKNPLEYHTSYDTDVLNLINKSIETTIALLPYANWLDDSSLTKGLLKIVNLTFDFFDAPRDINIGASYYGLNGPPFNGSRLLQSYYEIQSKTKWDYWSALGRMGRGLDNKYHVSSLHPGFELILEENLLFLPVSVIGNLLGVSTSIQPLEIPKIGRYVAKALMRSVLRKGSQVVSSREEKTWMNTSKGSGYHNITECLQKQYFQETTGLAQNVSLLDVDDYFEDNAAIHLLYELFRTITENYFPELKNFTTDISGLKWNADRLFFVNYAIGLCDHQDDRLMKKQLHYGVIPNKLTVNIPLLNFPKFAKVFNCSKSSRLGNEERCQLWTPVK